MNFKTPVYIATSSAGLKTAEATSSGNHDRQGGFIIQNQKAEKLYVKLGLACSATSYDFILIANSGAADGTMAPLHIPGYTGPVSVKDSGTPSYTFTELTG